MSDICDEVSALQGQDTTTPDPRPRKKQEISKGQASTTELSIEESPRARKKTSPAGGSLDRTMRAEHRATGKERAETLREPPFTSAHVKNCDIPGLEPSVARETSPREVGVGPSRGEWEVVVDAGNEDGVVLVTLEDDVFPADEANTMSTTEPEVVDGSSIGDDETTNNIDENQARSTRCSDAAMVDKTKPNNINDDLLSRRAGTSHTNTPQSFSFSHFATQDTPRPTNDPVALRRQLIILLHQQTEAMRQTHERHEAQRTADRAILKSQLARHDAARAREHDSMERAFQETRELVSRFMP